MFPSLLCHKLERSQRKSMMVPSSLPRTSARMYQVCHLHDQFLCDAIVLYSWFGLSLNFVFRQVLLPSKEHCRWDKYGVIQLKPGPQAPSHTVIYRHSCHPQIGWTNTLQDTFQKLHKTSSYAWDYINIYKPLYPMFSYQISSLNQLISPKLKSPAEPRKGLQPILSS